MATANPFDLLGDDDNDDPSQLIIAAQQQKLAAPPAKKASALAAQPAKQAKLPSKPLPPSQAVREAKNEGGRGGGGRGFGRGRGGGGGGFNRDSFNNDNTSGNNDGYSGGYRSQEGGDSGRFSERRSYGAPRGSFRGGRRGDFSNGETAEGERPRRVYDRRSGTGRGGDFKRDGAGRGNWGTPTDEISPEVEEQLNENVKNVVADKKLGEEDAVEANKDNPVNESEEKEPENKEMTLEEYEKVLEEKRKALQALKTEERKVNPDKELQSMELLSSKKKANDEVFIKLGSEKDKRKEVAEKEEKARKSLNINEFLKPAEGERYQGSGGRGRGRGRGSRGAYAGASNVAAPVSYNVPTPSIQDPGHFPALGAK